MLLIRFAIVPVTRTYGSAGRVTIDYETVDGVAIAGKDYVSVKGTLVFEDGETSKDIKVPVILDALPDEHENFCIALSNPTGGATMGKLNMSVMTIVGDTDIDTVAQTLANLLRQREGTLQLLLRPDVLDLNSYAGDHRHLRFKRRTGRVAAAVP
eukprot:SAG31_NODE_3647_length_4030_cov_2.232002_2_plen_155_part_00